MLARRAMRFAACLHALPGKRAPAAPLPGVAKIVAIDLGNHPLFPEVFLGATCPPFAAAVFEPAMPAAQGGACLAALRPDFVVTAHAGTALAGQARALGLPVMLAADLASDDTTGAQPASLPRMPAATDDPFLIGFTSGTTARPKAFFRSRASWRASLARGHALFELGHRPATLSPGSLAHGLGLYAMIETLHAGGTFHALPRWVPDAVIDLLASGAIRRLVAVPTMIARLDAPAAARGLVFPAVEAVITAGDKLNAAHIAQMATLFPRAGIREYYGASELGFVSVGTVRPENPAMPPGSVGMAFPGVTISIRDSQGRKLGPGEAGIVHVESDLVCDGYLWGDDGQAFRRHGGEATVGDLGWLSEAGALTLLGREGGMIVTSGFNVYPSEVEAALRAVPGITEAIVLGVDDALRGKALVAVLAGALPAAAAVAEALQGQLPPYKIPRRFVRAEAWPMTASGKIARGEVEILLKAGHYANV